MSAGGEVTPNSAIHSEKKKKKAISKLLRCVCLKRELQISGDSLASLRVPDAIPIPSVDCERLKKAFQGLRTDTKTIISILGHRDASQRGDIREAYQLLYNESLISRLHLELSGDLRKAVKLWTYDPPERDARLAFEALRAKKKPLKHLQVIIEIACASSPHHLAAVRKAYCSLHECSFEEDIVSHVAMPLRKILLAIVSAYRYDKYLVETELAKSDALKIHEAIESNSLINDEFMYILSTRSFHHLREAFHRYEKTFGTTLYAKITDLGKGELETLLGVVIRCIVSPEKHFAEVINRAVTGLGTDEDSLTRAIVSRAEVDMVRIKRTYVTMYHASLEGAVSGDTSGYYKKFLMTLLGAI